MPLKRLTLRHSVAPETTQFLGSTFIASDIATGAIFGKIKLQCLAVVDRFAAGLNRKPTLAGSQFQPLAVDRAIATPQPSSRSTVLECSRRCRAGYDSRIPLDGEQQQVELRAHDRFFFGHLVEQFGRARKPRSQESRGCLTVHSWPTYRHLVHQLADLKIQRIVFSRLKSLGERFQANIALDS